MCKFHSFLFHYYAAARVHQSQLSRGLASNENPITFPIEMKMSYANSILSCLDVMFHVIIKIYKNKSCHLLDDADDVGSTPSKFLSCQPFYFSSQKKYTILGINYLLQKYGRTSNICQSHALN